MDELKKLFKREIDSDFKEQKRQEKQEKGFLPEGVKISHYISKNFVEVYEVESNVEYGMEYLQFIRIAEVMGFEDRALENAKGKLLNGYYTIFDFDNKEIMVYDLDERIKPIGKYLTQGKEKHEGVFGDEDLNESSYDTETFSKWYSYINKN